MKLKLSFCVLFLTACSYSMRAQQVFAISQYMQNNFIYNPAASGAAENASVGAFYRKMWSGIDGGPQTTILYGDTYFEKKRTGLSVFVYDDKTGPTKRTGGQFNLSYSINLGPDKSKRLMFGLGAMFMQYQLDKSVISSDLNFNQNDPLVSAADSKFTGDATAGIYYKSPTLNIGASISQIIQSKLGFVKSASNIEGQLYRHYYFMADYNIRTDDEDVLIPSVLWMYLPNAPSDFQAGVKLLHQDLIWIGFGYHYQQSFSAYAGVKIKHRFEIGYAYDQYQTPLNFVSTNGNAGNELSLKYNFINK